MTETALAFGSNVGDRVANIEAAIARLAHNAELVLMSRSSLYETPPWGVEDQAWFLNACALFDTDLAPHALLTLCKSIERDLGRAKTRRWGPRMIDIDILTYRGPPVSDKRLTIPHPRLVERGFVLVPLVEIAPDLDVGGLSARDALEHVETAGITLFDPYPIATAEGP
ncbi:MAG: 2-amino-4-hydroxy-6-hydroxymethyldihydropteridine diphosphokinase [Pseudomonadota bacterium]